MENNSEDENSDNGLQIVVESPRPKKRNKKELDESDKKIIETVEKDLEENLEVKAAKAKLTAKHVKNIIKEVVTNEHVLALVRHAENPENNDEPVTVYEPKYTRAKTKELLSANTQQKILPWMSPTRPVSEVQMLFNEDLQEDSSGDEYVPEKPSKNSSFTSQLDVSQATIKDAEETNIALRTRSKLSLSHTPLEVIEEAFMPPDITTDMYDMDCDDDVWKEFLKTFTRPLDEVTKAAEDEDHDPEYNVLADEEIDEVDKEELRADRAVTVSRKEFNCLMAELFEFADIYESNKLDEKNAVNNNLLNEKGGGDENANAADFDPDDDPNISIKKCQIPILAQQMRQHVQLLTQNFILTYEHPEFAYMAAEYKEMLNDINTGCEGKNASIYYTLNLQSAMKLIEYWENLFASGTSEVVECKRYVEKVISESTEAKRAGTEYIVTFPSLIMETISKSDVFIYPNLLPRIPFKSINVTRCPYYFFTPGEDSLIALFLEQAIPYLKQDNYYLSPYKQLNMERVCQLLSILLMPNVNSKKILRHIRIRKHPDSNENPIKFFYRTKKAPPTIHYVIPVDVKDICPPCKRSPDLLPLLWRNYIYPNRKNETKDPDVEYSKNSENQVIIVSYPLHLRPITNRPTPYNVSFSKKIVANRLIQPKGPLPTLTTSHRKRRQTSIFRNCAKENKIPFVSQKLNKVNRMLPDMPSLGLTPVKKDNQQTETPGTSNIKTSVDDKQEQSLSFKNITSFEIQFQKPDLVSQAKRNFESVSEFSSSNKQDESGSSRTSGEHEKDNPDDINELMIASSTVKSVTKKEPSGAEKKRAKMRREFLANLVMASPDPLETQALKEENFADAFFDKLRQTLTPEDHDKLMAILGHYDQTNGDLVQLFNNVQSILSPTYQELSDEFYLFLTDLQALKVGKLMPYFMMKDMNRFAIKLQVYFKDQPTQWKKFMKCFTDLTENSDVTMETIKTTLLPLLKGNAALTDWFLQLFPNERPPKLLTTGPHELIDMSKELARQPGEDICETVILPDTEDPFGGSSCICACHNVEDPQFKSRSQHCKQCGLKFIQGKIYIQTGKALRPAIVSFITNPEKDHLKRLTTTQRKRSETSPTKQVTSPNKENHTHEEHRHSNESEDDETKKKNQKQSKTQRKRKIKDPDKSTVKESGKGNSKEATPKVCEKIKSNVKPAKNSPKRQNKKRTVSKKSVAHKPGSTPGQQKRPADEQEIEYSEPAEYIELKVSSDHSGESESECFESSQDITNTDSEDSNQAAQNSESSKNVSWTREEDKIILQTLRQSSDNEETFKQISEVLRNRSVIEIKNRFHKLMSLLQQMA